MVIHVSPAALNAQVVNHVCHQCCGVFLGPSPLIVLSLTNLEMLMTMFLAMSSCIILYLLILIYCNQPAVLSTSCYPLLKPSE